MKEYCEELNEQTLLEDIRRVLENEPALADAIREAGFEINFDALEVPQ